MIADGRGNFGLQAAYASRYKIYSGLFLIFCFHFVANRATQSGVSRARNRLLYQAAVLASVLDCARGDVAAWRLLSQRRADEEQI